MFSFLIQIIQVALDELGLDLSEISEVEIEPYLGESYWLNFDNGKYYACVNQPYGELSVWLAGSYPLPGQ